MNIVEQVAEKLEYTVKVDDFVPVGTLRPTESGLARCKTEDFGKVLHVIAEDAIGKGSKDGCDALFLYTALAVCADENNRGEHLEDCSDLTKFLAANTVPLSRLALPAWLTNFPLIMADMQI